ncbi:MAG: EAL domain-containing protein [Huintestinicola sp.]|uniref:EAL domain-containing protein n=1 Tax=Huintestinicola sp. TaxID=2981661 RepID=UPI003F111D17
MEGKKTIGICITKIHDISRSVFLDLLYRYAEEKSMKLIIYNSFIDFYNNSTYAEGARYVYDFMRCDKLDAVVIMKETFFNDSIVNSIIENARSAGVPVLTVKGKAEGCFSITDDYSEAYKEVIRHVITHHGARNTFYIAGRKDNDPTSDLRLGCYKAVLAENGIEFSEDNVAYGEYWEGPAKAAVDRLVEAGRVPRAILCANDTMAMAVCEQLAHYGYKVPSDVIVTGFDGLPMSDAHSPAITTCKENVTALAKRTIDMAEEMINGAEPYCDTVKFMVHKTESCGCIGNSYTSDRAVSSQLYKKLHEMTAHEDHAFSWIDHIMEHTSTKDLLGIISHYILGESVVYIRSDFLASIGGLPDEAPNGADHMTQVNFCERRNEPYEFRYCNEETIRADIKEKFKHAGMFVITPIFVEDIPCGFYVAFTNEIKDHAHKIRRISSCINIAFHEAVNRYKQQTMKQRIENAAYINPITSLPNLRGCCRWFNDFALMQSNHKKALAISVYGLRQYKYIYENYGIADIENAVKHVSEALRQANTTDCFVGQITEDEFVIVDYFDDADMISERINKATATFFPLIDDFNVSSGKEYFVEVNCGCTVVNPGWQGSLASFIKLASGEMYINRLKSGASPVIKENKSKHSFEIFSLLIKKNLFRYCFQPIVDVHTGEIFAYEALMRTESNINMSPLDVISTASEYNMLYDIERATMFNVIGHYSQNRERFEGKKLFINSIPGHTLNDEDNLIITEKYGELMDNFVFEITEQNSVSDDELSKLKSIGGTGGNNQIAIDDYGTGHSNIVNLMRYSPQIIKIDRFLISDVDKDVNKQMFIKSTIEFARINNIKVLAEGVETSEELKTVVSFGVDYVQGYYMGKPVFEPVKAIPDEIRREILNVS